MIEAGKIVLLQFFKFNLLPLPMEELKEKTIDLAQHIEDLADTFYKLKVVSVTKRATNLVSGVVITVLICLFGFFVLLFGSFALAWWLGDVLDSRIAGFLLTAVFFLLIILIVSLLKKQTIFPMIRNLIIRKVYE